MNEKNIPDDVILVCCGLFAAVLFAWSNIDCVFVVLDFWVFWIAVVCMIVVPLFYSSIVYYKNKK